jgi:hypothetical protein
MGGISALDALPQEGQLEWPHIPRRFVHPDVEDEFHDACDSAGGRELLPGPKTTAT